MKPSALPLAALCCTLLTSLFATSAHAKIVSRDVTYYGNNQIFKGFVAYDDAQGGKRPGVLVAHQWKGLGDYEKRRAKMLAQMGYVAFALDIYGAKVRPKTRQEAGAAAGKYKNNRPLWKQHARIAFDTLAKMPNVNPQKIAILGYCFGGGTALELARSGAPVKGAISFHGSLDTPTPAQAKNIKGSVLVLHGAVDPFSPWKQVEDFKNEMEAAKVDYEIDLYGGAVHSFTEREAGNDPSQGAAYNAKADARSWKRCADFLREVL